MNTHHPIFVGSFPGVVPLYLQHMSEDIDQGGKMWAKATILTGSGRFSG